jgi:hypothetical protein
MRLISAAVYATLLCCTAVALSQQPEVDADPLQLAVRARILTPEMKKEHPQSTALFEYTRSHQARVVRDLIQRIDLQESTRREAELKTLNESPLSTLLNLSRFLTSRGYKRADGSPLIDLTF